MADRRGSLLDRFARLDRRRLVAGVVGGSLLGSGWAVSFRDAVVADDEAHMTVARSTTALGVLIEYHGHRLMLVDAGDPPGADMVTDLASGFLRQRIDAVLVPASGVSTVTRAFMERWRVRDIWTLPGQPGAPASSLGGIALRIGDLKIECDALPKGAWIVGTAPETAWYVSVALGAAQCVVTPDGSALERLPLDSSMTNAVVCFDLDLELGTSPAGIDVLALPSEVADSVPENLQTVSLSRDSSVTFRLSEDRIETL